MNLKAVKTYAFAVLTVALTLILVSCDSLVYDDEGDCTVQYKMVFRYDMNLKWADAFPSEVKSVNLYAFDSNGVFVKEFSDRGDVLSYPGYCMTLDLPAGDYQFVAWCGLRNEGIAEESFTVPQPVPGQTTIAELTCSLNTKKNGTDAYSDTWLQFLYHGSLKATLPDTQEGKEYLYTMYLTKNTNHIRVILHEGGDMDVEDYNISIADANGVMSYDNTLLGNAEVTYLPYYELPVDMKAETDGSSAVSRGIMVDFSVGRMMADHRNDMMLTITNKKMENKLVVRLPVIHYALLMKTYYEMAYGHELSGLKGDQELLDREDEYVLTLILVNGKWKSLQMDILEWHQVFTEENVTS